MFRARPKDSVALALLRALLLLFPLPKHAPVLAIAAMLVGAEAAAEQAVVERNARWLRKHAQRTPSSVDGEWVRLGLVLRQGLRVGWPGSMMGLLLTITALVVLTKGKPGGVRKGMRVVRRKCALFPCSCSLRTLVACAGCWKGFSSERRPRARSCRRTPRLSGRFCWEWTTL